MSTQIDLVIRALDEFTPAFAQLDAVLNRVQGQTGPMAESLRVVDQTLGALTESAGGTEAALAEFSTATESRLGALAEKRRFQEEALAGEEAAAAQAHGERMLALEEAFEVQRSQLRDQARQRESQAQAAHLDALAAQEAARATQILAVEELSLAQRLNLYSVFYQSIAELARAKGGELARLAKGLAIAEASVKAYLAANNALAAAPYPLNLAIAAAVLTQGLANVERIRQVNVAHGGLETVPQDATYLLKQGERVLSPPQNRALTDFLDTSASAEGSGRVTIGSLTIHVLENATSAQSLLNMDPAELRRVVAEKLIPALDVLARDGIRPELARSNP